MQCNVPKIEEVVRGVDDLPKHSTVGVVIVDAFPTPNAMEHTGALVDQARRAHPIPVDVMECSEPVGRE